MPKTITEANLDKALEEAAGEIRAIIAFGDGNRTIKITQRQSKFIHTYLKTANFEMALGAAGVPREVARNWLKRDPKLRAFLKERIEYASKQTGEDFSKWISHLLDISYGRKQVSSTALNAHLAAGKALGFLKPDGTVNDFKNARVEFNFITGSAPGNAQLQPPLLPTQSRLPNEAFYFEHGGPGLGKDEMDDLPGPKEAGETAHPSMVCGAAEKPSEGHSLDAATGNNPGTDHSPQV